jgi:hypothetical protein
MARSVSTMVSVILSRLRDGTHPLAARTCEPRPLAVDALAQPDPPVHQWPIGAGQRWQACSAGSGFLRRVVLQASP